MLLRPARQPERQRRDQTRVGEIANALAAFQRGLRAVGFVPLLWLAFIGSTGSALVFPTACDDNDGQRLALTTSYYEAALASHP